MPFYEYECPSCRYYLEVMQKISDPPVKKCPSCGKSGFKRLISAPVFRLKGSGWYETDFKSDKENKRNLVGEEREPAKPSTDDKSKAAGASTDSAAATSKTAPGDGGSTNPAPAKPEASKRRTPAKSRASARRKSAAPRKRR